MSRLHLMVILGTRPEALKLIPVIRELRAHPESFEVSVISTGQHREMLEPILEFFAIRPDVDLDLMEPRQTLAQLTAKVIVSLEKPIDRFKPDGIIVQGDTTSAFAAALVGFYLRKPVYHVEAGLRTNNIKSPWPEELNRQLLSRIADYHFAPTPIARQNLIKENIAGDRILVTGNTVVDALLEAVDILQSKPVRIPVKLNPKSRLILVTAHRRESFGEAFRDMCEAMWDIMVARSDVELVYPVHMNPNVQEPVREILGGMERIHLIEPQDYPTFVSLMERSYLILTDSGGIQEEAPALGKPVLVMRENTERTEGIDAGTARLVGTDREKIFNSAIELLDNKESYQKMARAVNPYGDGQAAARIRNFFVQRIIGK